MGEDGLPTEGKEHASTYKKYRLSPTKEVFNLILTYLEKRKKKPFLLAVDVGCGSGQGTFGLAPHFQKVVGIDVSEAQLEEARREPGFTNVSYRLAMQPPRSTASKDNAALGSLQARQRRHLARPQGSLVRGEPDTLADLTLLPPPGSARPIERRPLGAPVLGRQRNSLDSNR
ncbi:UNVERIFIED_CONTAM: hypothetical protein FKN15_070810 [Acipenser sinensis]